MTRCGHNRVDPQSLVEGGFYIDQQVAELRRRNAERRALSPFYDASGQPSSQNVIGHVNRFDRQSAIMFDQPGGPAAWVFRFRTSVRGGDNGLWYGTIHWGFVTADRAGRFAVVAEYPPTRVFGRSATTDAAQSAFRRYWAAQGASVEPDPGCRAETGAHPPIQRWVQIAVDPAFGVPDQELSAANRWRFLMSHGFSGPGPRARLADRVLSDMITSASQLRFEDEGHLANELMKRVRIVELLTLSQRDGDRGFGYPLRDPAFAYGPRVNFSARDYWVPQPPPPWGYGRRPLSEAHRFPSPTQRAAHFGDQDPAGDYLFTLTPTGLRDPFTALVRLFDPEPAHRRTLIHCDYLISVIQFRSFAETLGDAEFNRRVAATIPMVLRAHGFTALTDMAGEPVPHRDALSLREFTPRSESELVIGDHVQFWNHPAYDLLIGAGGGVWRLENAIVVDRRNGVAVYEGRGSGRLLGRRNEAAPRCRLQPCGR